MDGSNWEYPILYFYIELFEYFGHIGIVKRKHLGLKIFGIGIWLQEYIGIEISKLSPVIPKVIGQRARRNKSLRLEMRVTRHIGNDPGYFKKFFLAIDSVNTREFGSTKAVDDTPSIKGNVNTSNRLLSA